MKMTRRDLLKQSVATLAVAGVSSVLIKEAIAADNKPESAKIEGLQHVAVFVTDMNKTMKYYETMFGFKRLFVADVMEGDKPLQLGFMKLNNCYIELLLRPVTTGIVETAMATSNHFCLRTDNADKMYEILKAKGANFETPVISAPIPFDREVTDKDVFKKHSKKGVNVKIFFMRGINGERIEIMQDNIG